MNDDKHDFQIDDIAITTQIQLNDWIINLCLHIFFSNTSILKLKLVIELDLQVIDVGSIVLFLLLLFFLFSFTLLSSSNQQHKFEGF